MERIDKNGKRIPTRNETANNIPPKPLLPRWLNNILVIVCTVFSTLLTLLVLLLLTKYFKMKSLIASLVLATLPPQPEATSLKYNLRQLELPGLPTMELTLKYHLNSEIQSFTPSLDNMYKNCKLFKYFPGNANPNNLKHNELTKAMPQRNLVSLKNPKRLSVVTK